MAGRAAVSLPKVRAALVLIVFGTYALAYVPLRALIGNNTAGLLAILPVCLAGRVYGLRGGLIAGLLITPTHTILMNLAGYPGWDVVLRETKGLGTLAVLGIGTAIGYWSDLVRDLKHHIDERARAEDALEESEAIYRQANEALQESEQRFSILTAAAFEGIVISDKGQIVELNEQLAEMLGYDRAEMIGRKVDQFVAPDSLERVLQHMRSGSEEPYEHFALRKDGSAFPVEIRAKSLPYKGRAVRVTAIRDNTRRNQFEAALRQSERRFSTLAGATFEGIIITDGGRIIDVNDQMTNLLGYERSEMVGRIVENFIAPESVEGAGVYIRSGSEQPFELVAVRKNHSRFPVEIRARVISYKDSLVSVIAVRDITERKHAELELRRRADETSALLETSLALNNLDLETILQTIGNHAKTLFAADGCRIFLAEPGDESLRCVLALQENGAQLLGLRIKMGEGVTGAVAASSQAEIVNDMLLDPRAIALTGAPVKKEAIMFAPLVEQKRSIGVLSIVRVGTQRPFQPADLALLEAFASMASSAVSNTRLVEETQRRLQRLSTLREIDQVIIDKRNLKMALNIILGYIVSQLNVDAAAMLLYEPENQRLKFAAGRGFHTQVLQYTRLKLGDGFAGQAALEQQIVQVSDTDWLNTGFLRSPDFHKEGFAAYIGVPVIAKGNLIGVLEIYHRQPLEADQEWMEFLFTLVGRLAIAVDSNYLFNGLQAANVHLQQAYDATIEGWAQALRMRDLGTDGHSQRTVDLTLALAVKMGIAESQLVHIRRGALLHDIGKMGVPDSILQKPGKLTEEEWQIMRMHPVYANQWLAPIAYLRPAMDIPYCHHEKWDGSGYPRGLKGDQIPLPARIFAVIDVWDAIRSDRPYQKGSTATEALAYIREQKGKHFDPKVVDAFLDVLAEKPSGNKTNQGGT